MQVYECQQITSRVRFIIEKMSNNQSKFKRQQTKDPTVAIGCD
jgi:hypothetical protein